MSSARFSPNQKAQAKAKGVSLVYIHIDGRTARPERNTLTFALSCPPEREEELLSLINGWFEKAATLPTGAATGEDGP